MTRAPLTHLPGINSDAVIEAIRARGQRWTNGNREPDGNKIALVIEGGAMRGIRSAGGLLALEAMGLSGVFDEVYGCSAGAVNACYFLSGQGAYGTTIYYQNINNRKFIHPLRLWKIVDLDFLFDQVMVHEKPLRVSNVIHGPTQLFISVTDVASATGRIIHAQQSRAPLTTQLKASSAMPIVYNEHVLIEGRRCIDGGVTNSIPLDAAIASGCTHILVLLTRAAEYRNPDAGWIERHFFGRTCGWRNEALCKLHLRGDRQTNKMRDLAFGRSAPDAAVSIATLAPSPDDIAVDRTTTDADRLKSAATQFAAGTFAAFGADVDQLTEVFQPFQRGAAGIGQGPPGERSAADKPAGHSAAFRLGAIVRRNYATGRARRLAIGACVILLIGLWATHWVFKRAFGYSPPPGGVTAITAPQDIVPYDFAGLPGPDGVPAPWQSRIIVGTMNVQVTGPDPILGRKLLHFTSQDSHFIIYNGSKSFDPKEHPFVCWDWKGTTLPTDGDVRTHGEFYYSSANRNDSGLQVLVGFEGDNVLSYIWDTSAPVGTELDEWSPVATVKTRVIESGPAGLDQWQHFRINVYEDYKRRFGKESGKVVGVSVQTNSNHTQTSSEGFVGPISFQRP